MAVEYSCYNFAQNEFLGFIDSKPNVGDYIRIHRLGKGMWSYKVYSVELIYDRPSNLNKHFLENVRIDLTHGTCMWKEEDIP